MDYEKALRTMSVLYCEDEADARKQMERILGYRVGKLYVAENGKQGLEIYKDKHIDLIISDIKMPKLNGLEMSREIKAINPKAEIILLTAFDHVNFLQEAIDIGVSQYVIKPIGEMKLFNAVNRVLNNVVAVKKVAFQNRYIRDILDMQRNMVIVGDTKAIHAANKAFLNFFGCETLEELIKANFSQINDRFQFEEYEFLDFKQWFMEMITSASDKREIYILKGDENVKYSCEVSDFENISGRFLLSLTDISHVGMPSGGQLVARLVSEEEAPFELFNKKSFLEDLGSFVALSSPKSVVLIIFSIVGFSRINIKYGYEKGDALLKKVADFANAYIKEEKLFSMFESAEYLMAVRTDDMKGLIQKASMMKKEIGKIVLMYDDVCRVSLHHVKFKQEEDLKEKIEFTRRKHLKVNLEGEDSI